MRGSEVGKLLENVGVRFQAAGRAFAFGEEGEPVIDYVVSGNAAKTKQSETSQSEPCKS
jgi:hypothetical protein